MANTVLMLDALFPPTGDRLVSDLNAAGARGVGAYVFRRDASGNALGVGSWEPTRVASAQRAGKFVLPIMVPGSSPRTGDILAAIDNANMLGIVTRVMVIDIEQFSLPPSPWVRDSIDAAHAHGYRVWHYGDLGVLSGYPAADGNWLSHGRIPVRAGTYLPAPALPSDCVADQYAVGVNINGSSYDVSILDIDALSVSSSAQPEVVDMGGRIVRAPWAPGRLDIVWVGLDSSAMQAFSDGGAGGLDGGAKANIVAGDSTPHGGFFDVDAVWDNLNRLCYLGSGNDGNLYLAVQNAGGEYAQGWTQIPGVRVTVPMNPAPVIQPAPDNVLRDTLRAALDGLK